MFGYLGPEGTFTHQALMALADKPDFVGDVTNAHPFQSVATALEAVRAGLVDAVMVPIENSVEGGVSATLDYLGTPDAVPLQIISEVLVNVTFDLAVRPGTLLGDVRQVITHPHAAAQTRAWLAAALPQASIIERGSTAAAAKEVAESRECDAAICAPVATKLYGLMAAAHDIADNEAGVTRFVLVTKRCACPPPTGHDKTTLMAYLRADRAGALLEILTQLAVRGVNLCRIESRPTKTTLGSYCFSIDAEGHIHDARLAEALVGLKRVCQDVVFLGSYARADNVETNIADGACDADYEHAQEWFMALHKDLKPFEATIPVAPPEEPPATVTPTEAPSSPVTQLNPPSGPMLGLSTSLFVSKEDDAQADPGIIVPQMVSAADGIPLIYQILVSQHSQLTPSVSTASHNSLSITGDFQLGRDRLLEFLRALAERDLFNHDDLLAKVNQLSSTLITASPTPRYVGIEIGQESNFAAGPEQLASLTSQVFADIQDIDGLIQWYLDYFGQLKVAGMRDEMWLRLG